MRRTDGSIEKKCRVSLRKVWSDYGSEIELTIDDSGDARISGHNYPKMGPKVDNLLYLKRVQKYLTKFIDYVETGKEPEVEVPIKQWYEF